MRKEISRRDFLKVGGAVIGAGAVGATGLDRLIHSRRTDKTLGVEFDQNPELSFEEMAQFAKRLDRAYDKLPVPKFENTNEELLQFALEIIPQYEYEEIVNKAVFPQEVKFVYMPDGMRANHVLGQSDCLNYAVVNGRMTLDTSTWNKEEALFTIAHELGHVQQGMLCQTTETSLVENSAQIGAMEVMCGLANQGNPTYLWAVVAELRGMAMSAAYGIALKDKQPEKYERLRKELSPGAIAQARSDKSQRRWSSDPQRLSEILEWYNTEPLRLIFNAVKSNNEISGLAFPPFINYAENYWNNAEAEPIRIDDTAYVLANLEKMVDWVARNGKGI